MPDLKQITIPDGTTYDLRDSRCVAATSSSLGLVQPDNSTITINANGVISASGGGGGTQTTWWGTSSTAARTAEKVVVCEGFSLAKGAVISVLFSTANTAAAPTLNVNSTGAKRVYVGTSLPNSTTNTLKWSANTILTFAYDGTYFRYLSARTPGGTISPDGAGSWYGTSSSAATSSYKDTTIANFRLTPGARVTVSFTNANTYTSGVLSLNVNSTGDKQIYVDGAKTSTTNTLLWDAGETLTFVYSGSYYYFVGRSKASGGGSTVAVTQVQTSGTEIARISVDGTSTSIYAPSGGGSASYTTTTATLTVAGWSNNTQTVSVSSVTATSDIIIAAAPANISAYAAAGIYCSAQAAGSLTFTCSSAPTNAITVNLMIFEGGSSIVRYGIAKTGAKASSVYIMDSSSVTGAIISEASDGETVYINSTDGAVGTLTAVRDDTGASLTLTRVTPSEYGVAYSFVMPSSPVTVTCPARGKD